MNSVINSISYAELSHVGNRFTWRKKKSWIGDILERLDKVMVSTSWLEFFPSASVYNHVFTSSDHYQIMIKIDNVAHQKAPSFRFEKMWSLRTGFDILVKKTWCSKFNG